MTNPRKGHGYPLFGVTQVCWGCPELEVVQLGCGKKIAGAGFMFRPSEANRPTSIRHYEKVSLHARTRQDRLSRESRGWPADIVFHGHNASHVPLARGPAALLAIRGTCPEGTVVGLYVSKVKLMSTGYNLKVSESLERLTTHLTLSHGLAPGCIHTHGPVPCTRDT